MQKAGAFDLIRKDNVVAETYMGRYSGRWPATQPVLILQETPSPKQASAESKQSDTPAPTEPLSIKEPKM